MKKNHVFTTKVSEVLAVFGENIKLARLRRRLSMEQLSERAGISRPTLSAVEKGAESVGIGIYVQVLFVLGLEKEVEGWAENDFLGRKLQDLGLLVKKRAPKK